MDTPVSCACAECRNQSQKEFTPTQKPPEWRLIDKVTVPSQFHNESGTLTYRCDVCDSTIQVEWRDIDSYNAAAKCCYPATIYWIESVSQPPPPEKDEA